MKVDIKGRTVAVIGKRGYIYNIQTEWYGSYHFIRLKETAANSDFSDKVYTHAAKEKTVVTINPQGTTVRFQPDPNTIFIGRIKAIEPMSSSQMKSVLREIEREHKIAEFHKFLKEIGLTFNIDYHPYREDSDHMTVYYKGKEIFSGTTEDLQ